MLAKFLSLLRFWPALVLLAPVFGQSVINLASQSRNADFSNFTSTRTVTVGNTLPPACLLGQLYFNSTAPAGNNLFGCTAPNSWIQLSGAATLFFTSPLSFSGQTLSLPRANGLTDGYLNHADWTTFNSKQPPANYLIGLTGDVTAAGPGSSVATLATVNSAPGACGDAAHVCQITTNAKGLVTAQTALPVSANATSIGGVPVSLTAPTNLQVLQFQSGPNTYLPVTLPGATSTNASSIQGIPVIATAPTNNQALIFNTASGMYVPTTNPQASGVTDGYLYHTDWATFNGKQPAGNYLIGLTGDVLASGPGSPIATLATVNSAPGPCGDATHVCQITTNGKGLVTAQTALPVSNNASSIQNIPVAATAPTNNQALIFNSATGSYAPTTHPQATSTVDGYLNHADWTTFNSKQPAGSYLTGLTGDVTASGPGSPAATLATVNGAPGACGDATHLCQITTNGKGLVTAQTALAVSANATSITGIPVSATIPTNLQVLQYQSGPNTYLPVTLPSGTSANASSIQNIPVASTAPTNNQALIFNSATGSYAPTTHPQATSTVDGYLNHADWTTFNGKQSAGSYLTGFGGDVTASGPGSPAATLATVNSAPGACGDATHLCQITTNGKGLVTAQTALAVSANATSIQSIAVASTTPTNNQALIFNSATGTYAPTTHPQATSTIDGYLNHTDWTTFNSKQPAGSYLTGFSGDVTASGPGSPAATLATVNSAPGACGDATHLCQITTNGKGLVTAQTALAVTSNATSIQSIAVASTAPTNNQALIFNSATGTYAPTTHPQATSTVDGYLNHADWTTFNGKQPAGSYLTGLTGDVTASGPGSPAATLATVNGAPGACGDATHLCQITTNGKGLVTAQTALAVSANATSITGIPVSATAPANLQVLQYQSGSNTYLPVNLPGGTSATSCTQVSAQLNDFVPVYSATAGGTLTLNSNASAAAPAIAQVGAVFYRAVSAASAFVGSGSGNDTAYGYIDAAGNLDIGTSTIALGCTACTYVAGVSAFPAASKPLFTWTIASGAFTTSGYTDYRAFLTAPGIIQNIATSADPGCTLTAHIGRQWMDNTSAATTHFKVCSAVSSSPAWVTVF